MAHISFSELKEWVTCPWKHKLTYIDKIDKFIGSEHTAFGTAMHTICETLVQLENTENYNAKKHFQEEFLKNLQELKELDPAITLNTELVLAMRTQGDKLTEYVLPGLKKYFGNFKLISVEEKLFEPIENKDYDFKGFVQLVIQTSDKKYHVIDWKTCSWGWDQRKKTDKLINYQLTLYKHFWCKKNNINPTDALTHFALLKRTAKNNHVEIFKATSGQKKTENALKLLNKAIYNIQKQNHVKNKLSCYGRYGTCMFYNTPHCT